ncbi:ArgS-related anticodon-binding protein NrtL [Streptomyces sp. NPDC048182]|uniref:ArgS-related anticodon-binding protein NrtL n=1 Tax=Streptomyces sp. NPDC048182 TaxID=3365507 RepID=UPI0037217D57
MTPVELSRTVLHAVRLAVDAGELDVAVPEKAVVAPPRGGGCGDYATGIALQLARAAQRPAPDVAAILQAHLARAAGIRDVVLTGPGFLNISLASSAPAALVREILERRERYGCADAPDGRRLVRLHCPLDPRALVVADAAARILRSQGVPVRLSCEAALPVEWRTGLGVSPDAVGPAPAETSVDVRPVPAPGPPEDLLALGPDAARWALLHPAPHDRPDIGPGCLAQRETNPLFRVRYAHARALSVQRNAADLGFAAEPGLVDNPLVGLLADHPRVLATAAEHRAPDRLARHLVAVADAALPFLVTVLPRGAEKPEAAHRARLALAEAVGAVLAGGLTLLGIDAPDHL